MEKSCIIKAEAVFWEKTHYFANCKMPLIIEKIVLQVYQFQMNNLVYLDWLLLDWIVKRDKRYWRDNTHVRWLFFQSTSLQSLYYSCHRFDYSSGTVSKQWFFVGLTLISDWACSIFLWTWEIVQDSKVCINLTKTSNRRLCIDLSWEVSLIQTKLLAVLNTSLLNTFTKNPWKVSNEANLTQ